MKLLFQLVVIFMLSSSCGFRPIYESNSRYSKKLSQIEFVINSNTVLTEYFKDHLVKSFNPNLLEEESKYILKITLEKNKNSVFINPQGFSSRDNISLYAEYNLTDKKSNKTIYRGTDDAKMNVEIGKDRFSNYKLKEQTYQHLSKILSANIRDSIIKFLILQEE